MLTRSYCNPAGEVEEKNRQRCSSKTRTEWGVLSLRRERVVGLRGRDWRWGPRKRIVPAGLALNKEGTPTSYGYQAIQGSQVRKRTWKERPGLCSSVASKLHMRLLSFDFRGQSRLGPASARRFQWSRARLIIAEEADGSGVLWWGGSGREVSNDAEGGLGWKWLSGCSGAVRAEDITASVPWAELATRMCGAGGTQYLWLLKHYHL